jgi:general secretion pathway protein C
MRPKAIFIVINLICIMIMAYFAVDGLYEGVTDRLGGGPVSTEKPAYPVSDAHIPRKPLSAYNAVLERNLFETRTAASIQAKSNAEKLDVESLEETKLNLKLWGTVSGTRDGDYAVIEDVKTHQQELYRTGDTIQAAVVKEIFREKVVLTVDGKDEVLQMQDMKAGKSTGRSGRLASGRSTPTNRAVRAQRISLRRSYIDQAMTDVGSLMTQVKIQPHMEDGVPAGLSLSRIKPNSIFRRMGLRNGDVITGVDGTEISTVDDALRLVDNLRSSSSLSVQLKRRGRDKNIEYRIR